MKRREFLKTSAAISAGLFGVGAGVFSDASEAKKGTELRFPTSGGIRFGLCTYLWGAKIPLPELLDACAKSGAMGLELRCQHAHGVEPELDAAARTEIKKRFADSGVTLVGFGTNEDFHHTDPAKVEKKLARAMEYVRLSADCGGWGVKVKPNDLPKEVDRAKTTAQIAAALDRLGTDAAELGQLIRLENHGGCAPIPIMKEIIDQVQAKNVGLCWNCNEVDKDAPGIEANLRSVLGRLGDTIHIHEFNAPVYPYQALLRILREANWNGWLLMEAHTNIADAAELTTRLRTERECFEAELAR